MAGIEGIGPPGIGPSGIGPSGIGPSGTSRSNATSEGSTGRFTLDMAGSTVPARSAETTQATTPAYMLSLQEVDSESLRDRAARRHGRALLAALVRLQHALLGASDEGAALQEIAALAAGVPDASDPGVTAALHAVVLRARIELARRGE